MPLDDYLVGPALFATVLGCVMAGAWLCVERRLPHLRGPLRWLAISLVGTVGLSASISCWPCSGS